MKAYRLVLEADAVHALLRWKLAERRYLISVADRLAADPYTKGGFQETDDTGRFIEILLIPKFSVSYWADHAVREMRIVRLERLKIPSK